MNVITSSALANGLRTEFIDTYLKVRQTQADSRLSIIMDQGIPATNRQHEFAYFESAPYLRYWPRGTAIPADAFDSNDFSVSIYEWAQRVKWSKWDREDDQTKSLVEVARQTGLSAGLLQEQFAFDMILGTTSTLPAAVLAPDGAALFAPTAGGAARFGVTGGNVVTGSGVATSAQILTDYYAGIVRMGQFLDTKSQPLLNPSIIGGGVLIVAPLALQQVMETAFLSRMQPWLVTTAGAVSGTLAIGTQVSNLVQDASRNVQLWFTPRLTDAVDWYIFLLNAPKKPLFTMDRQGLREFTSLEGDNNSDSNRTNAEEYIQWELRLGPGIALPYACVKINNT